MSEKIKQKFRLVILTSKTRSLSFSENELQTTIGMFRRRKTESMSNPQGPVMRVFRLKEGLQRVWDSGSKPKFWLQDPIFE